MNPEGATPGPQGEAPGFGSLFPHAREALHAVSLCLAGLACALLAGYAFHKGFLIDKVFELSTLVAVAFIYIARPQADLRALMRVPSPAVIGWSLAGFFFALVASRNWAHYGLVLGVFSGLFVRIRPRALWQDLTAERKTGIAVLAAALSGPVMMLAQKYIWMPLAYVTATLMAMALTPFYAGGMHISSKADILAHKGEHGKVVLTLKAFGVQFNRKQTNFVMLSSENMYMKFIAAMNVSNGLFMLVFMVGIWALMGGGTFRRLSNLKIYSLGMAFVLLGNALWMSLMYLMLPPLTTTPGGTASELRKLLSIGNTPLIGLGGYAVLCISAVVLLLYYAQRQPRR